MMRRGVLIGVGSIVIAAAIAAGCGLTDGLTGGAEDDAGPDGPGDDAGSGEDVAPTCDADLARSVENCGACGRACPFGRNSFAICDGGGCVLACATGFGDCDDASANGCETNLLTTRTHCNACGHDCLGGACSNGTCQPFEMIGKDGNVPLQIVADGTFIYGINAKGAVTRIPKDGGPAQFKVLVASGEAAQVIAPRIAMANGTLYYTTFGDGGADGGPSGAVMALAPDGGKPFVLTTGDEPFAISAAGNYVYWSEGTPTESAGGKIWRCDTTSGCNKTKQMIDSAPTAGRIFSVLADAQGVTWANAGSPDAGFSDSTVRRCSPGCSALSQVLPPPNPVPPLVPFALAQDNAGSDPTIYWTTQTAQGVIASCSKSTCGNAPTIVDSYQYMPRFLAVDGDWLFWTTSDGTVRTIGKNPGGGAERQLYVLRGSSPWDILADRVAIYWTDKASQTLYRLAR